MSVVVVGGGIAGTAAAWTAAARGARVTLVAGGSGASTLATGAVDHDLRAAAPRALERGEGDVLRALDAFVVPEDRGVLVATTAGVVRPARGHDAALLDLSRFAGKRIGVVRALRPGWDGDALARCWTGQHSLEAVPLDATILRHHDERALPDADFAARHDSEARLAWLAERLRDALGRGVRVTAVVLPASLGADRPRAEALSALVGLPCGEASASPGGPSGQRFHHARDRALAAAGVQRVAGRVVSVVEAGSAWRVGLEGDEGLEADAVVLAIGGLLGGGVEYASSEWFPASELPPAAGTPFRLTVACDALRVGAHSRALGHPGSLFGVPPESLAWPFTNDAVMDRVGALADEDGRAAVGLYVAGEAKADSPHAWLAALASGARAGMAASVGRVEAGANGGREVEASVPA